MIQFFKAVTTGMTSENEDFVPDFLLNRLVAVSTTRRLLYKKITQVLAGTLVLHHYLRRQNQGCFHE